MARPLRLEFAGALYHVTARGDGREDIYRADGDRRLFLDVLGEVWERFNWTVHAYCLMTNHYHLLVETPDANLAKGMRQLNGVYTQRFNRIYERVGHVFQGRYKAILVQKQTYLLELARYSGGVWRDPRRSRRALRPLRRRGQGSARTVGAAQASGIPRFRCLRGGHAAEDPCGPRPARGPTGQGAATCKTPP
jgi:REP element-mobilizing transposase RayT